MKQYLHIRWSAVPDQTFVLNLDPTFDPIKEKNNLFYLKHKSFNFLGGELQVVFCDGQLKKDWTLAQIRERVSKNF
jgi:hypothetical protein